MRVGEHGDFPAFASDQCPMPYIWTSLGNVQALRILYQNVKQVCRDSGKLLSPARLFPLPLGKSWNLRWCYFGGNLISSTGDIFIFCDPRKWYWAQCHFRGIGTSGIHMFQSAITRMYSLPQVLQWLERYVRFCYARGAHFCATGECLIFAMLFQWFVRYPIIFLFMYHFLHSCNYGNDWFQRFSMIPEIRMVFFIAASTECLFSNDFQWFCTFYLQELCSQPLKPK